MTNVFIVNAKFKLDYKKALKYGALIPITCGSMNLANTKKLMKNLNVSLKNYTKNDYLLLSGNSFTLFLVMTWLFVNKPEIETYNILVYDPRKADYVLHTYNFQDFMNK